jgi:type I restriction enzyme S subunit
MIAPKLRFKSSLGKEFPSWTKKKLIELSEGGFSNGVFNDPKKVGTGYRLINVLDMYIPSTIDESKLSRVAIGEAEFENNKVEHGDIFFTRSSLVKEGIAFSNVYLGNSDDITFDGHLIRLRPKKDLINAVCLNYLLRTKSVRNQLVMRGKTATMTTIGQADIATVDVEVPSIDEQQKIASFLSLVDSRIETIAKQYELLVEYKKGVMQKIFNQEIRFKDGAGKDFPDWEYVPLEEVLDYEQPGRYLVSSTKYSDDFDTPVLTAGKTFLLGYTDEINGIFTDLPVIIFDDFTTAFKFVDFPFKAKSSAMKMLKNINSDNYLRYIYEAMCRIDFQGGDEHKRYWISQYSKITIPLPHHDEQIKILEFSAGIDKKIGIIQSKLELTKQYKQGLLQQMFI